MKFIDNDQDRDDYGVDCFGALMSSLQTGGIEKQKESWNIGWAMKDTWSHPKIFSYEEHPTEGEVPFKGTAYYTSEKPGMGKPPAWTYAGDEAEPLCKGGVCLADTSHNGLGKEPPANSNKVQEP